MGKLVRRFALAAALATCAAGCKATNDHAVVREKLGLAATRIDASELEGSARSLDQMLRDAPSRDASDAVQRFYTALLLVRTHLAAAFSQPFITAPIPARGANWHLDAKRDSSRQGAPIAHLVAAIHDASYARSWYADVKSAPKTSSDELLPKELASFAPRSALAYLNLAMLTCYSRLNFQDRVEEIIDGIPELASLDACDALIAETHSSEGARPWIYRGVYEHLKRVDEPAAYKFAIRTLESSPKSIGAPSAQDLALIAHWITTDSRYVFKCPSCKTLVDPALSACTVCRRPNLEFEAELRESVH